MAQATLSCRYAAIHLVYHGFYTLRGRKFPHGNFRTTRVLRSQNTDCRKNEVFRQAQRAAERLSFFCPKGSILRPLQVDAKSDL